MDLIQNDYYLILFLFIQNLSTNASQMSHWITLYINKALHFMTLECQEQKKSASCDTALVEPLGFGCIDFIPIRL